MTDLNQNLSEAFKWVAETYKFTGAFLNRLHVQMQNQDPPLERLYRNHPFFSQTTADYDQPENKFYRGLGDVFIEPEYSERSDILKQEDILEEWIQLDLALPFVFVRFTDRDMESFQPEIMYGWFQDFEHDESPSSANWVFFRHIINKEYEKIKNSEDPIRIDRDDVIYNVDATVEPISEWIEESEEEQQKRIEDLAEQLGERYEVQHQQ